MKKLFSILMSIMLVVTLIPGMAFAEGVGATDIVPDSVTEYKTVFSDNPLLNSEGLIDGPLDESSYNTGLEITISKDGNEPPVKRTRYVYVGTFVNDILTEAQPVTGGLKVQYLLSASDSGPTFDPNTSGVTVIKSTEYEEGNDCRYSFEIDHSAYEYFEVGNKFYDVRPEGMNNVGNAGIRICISDNDDGNGDGSGDGGNEGPSGGYPGTLFWALVPAGADPAVAPSGNIEWNSGALELIADEKTVSDNNVDVYLAFPNGDSLEPVNTDPSLLSQDGSNSFELNKNGYVYTINPGSDVKNDWLGISLPGGPTFQMGIRIGDGSGLVVKNNETNISYADGDTIFVPERGGLNLEIYYNGIANNGTFAFAIGDREICSPGVSPNRQYMEVYPSKNAVSGQSCSATLYYGGSLNQESGDIVGAIAGATFTIEITPTVKLQAEDGSWILPGDTIGGTDAQDFQLYFGGTKITDANAYDVSVGGNTVCELTANNSGKLTFVPVGNGFVGINVGYDADGNGSREEHVNFTWYTENLETSVCTVKMSCDGKTILPGEKITLRPNSSYTGTFKFNGSTIAANEYSIRIFGNGETVSVDTDGVFTITTGNSTGYKTVEFSYVDQNQKQYTALFNLQVQNPREYVLQFNFFEKVAAEYKAGGYSTIGIFDKQYEEWYVKYVVTDEEMRPVGDGHFVNLTAEDLSVGYYDKNTRRYNFIDIEDSPFTFTPVSGQSNMMKITYDRNKDAFGPAYIFLYDNYMDDPYLSLDSPQTPAYNAIFVWTKTVKSDVEYDDLYFDRDYWRHDGRMTLPGDFSGKKNDCEITSASMVMQDDLFGTGESQVEIVGDTTVMEFQTDLGTYVLDDTVLTKIDAVDTEVTLCVVDVDTEDEMYAQIADALANATEVIDLSLAYEGGKISDFGDGKVTITLSYELQDTDKMPVVYYVDDSGNEYLMECQYDAENGLLTFTTNHFSMFKVVETTDIGIGDTDDAIADDAVSDIISSIVTELVTQTGNITEKLGEAAQVAAEVVTEASETLTDAVDYACDVLQKMTEAVRFVRNIFA